jgi:hypothetical protein
MARQQWIFADGTIQSLDSKKLLEAPVSDMSRPVMLSACASDAAAAQHKWVLTEDGCIESALHKGFVLALKGGSNLDAVLHVPAGRCIVLERKSNALSQRWIIHKVETHLPF